MNWNSWAEPHALPLARLPSDGRPHAPRSTPDIPCYNHAIAIAIAIAIACCGDRFSCASPENQAKIIDCAKLLIDAEARLDNLQTMNGSPATILSNCIGNGFNKLAHLLLRSGARPNVRQAFARGCGHAAIWSNNSSGLQLLIDYGLDIPPFDADAQNLTTIAIYYSRTESFDILCRARARVFEANHNGLCAHACATASKNPHFTSWAESVSIEQHIRGNGLGARAHRALTL